MVLQLRLYHDNEKEYIDAASYPEVLLAGEDYLKGGAVYPFEYGEKVKAYLRRGAKELPGFDMYPNPQVGYGALCVRDSLPV